MYTRALYVVLGGLLLLLAAPVPSPTAPFSVPRSRPLPRVTLISDSVAGAISFDTGAKALLSAGIDLFLEPGQGRRLGGENPQDGATPTALKLIGVLGHRLGPTVIMCIGYNDLSTQYAQSMAAALAALHGSGVKHVLWVTLHVSPDHTSAATMNQAIEAAAAQNPAITVVDWNAYASGHPEWFQSDGVHLTGDGPRAMARLFHASLVKLGIPRPLTSRRRSPAKAEPRLAAPSGRTGGAEHELI
jgi:hypothetical protein